MRLQQEHPLGFPVVVNPPFGDSHPWAFVFPKETCSRVQQQSACCQVGFQCLHLLRIQASPASYPDDGTVARKLRWVQKLSFVLPGKVV